jgi:hypothetical protein
MRTHYRARQIMLRLSIPCLMLLEADAQQDGTSVSAKLRRALHLYLADELCRASALRRRPSHREIVAIRLGPSLWGRLSRCRANRSDLVERCAWRYIRSVSVSRETQTTRALPRG